MARRVCDCTVGWIVDPAVSGAHERTPVGCQEYRRVLRKASDYHRSLTQRERLILEVSREEGW